MPEHARRELAPILPMLVTQTRCEFLRLWRQPAFIVPSALFPLMFFTFFGLPRIHERIGELPAGPYLLSTFGAVSMTSVMLFSFGVGVAAERAAKIDVVMRAAPLRPLVHLSARVLTALGFGAFVLVLLFSYGGIVGVRQPAGRWALLALALLVGAVPFLVGGYAIGYLASANAAAPVVNLIWAPLSFGSGLFIPLEFLPHVIQQIAPYLPSYRYAQLARATLGATPDPLWQNVVWVLGYTLLFTAVALLAYRSDTRRKFS